MPRPRSTPADATRAPRRAPAQARGRERVDAILDAAATLVAERGVEGTTTAAIAERAGSAVGSLYQFFPTKEAIVHALAARYLEDLRAVYESALSFDAVALPIDALAERVIAPAAAFHARTPAYVHVYHATTAPGAPAGPERAFREAVVARAAALVVARAPHLTLERASAHAALVFETIHAALRACTGASPRARAQAVADLTRMIALYAAEVERPPARGATPSRET